MKTACALIADDDALVRFMLIGQLKAWGWSGIAVDDGAKVLEQIATRHFDVIILDVMMPGLDGLATLAAIRLAEAAGRPRHHVIMATAHEGEHVAQRLAAAGADGYVLKPVNPHDLAAALAKIT